MRSILVLTFILVFQWNTRAQEVIARYKFSEAEQAFNNGNYTTVLQNLDEVDKILGKPTPATLYLKIQARDKMIAGNPLGKPEELAKLQDDYLYYLKNFENTDETKYIEVFSLSDRYRKNNLDPQLIKSFLSGDPAASCILGEISFRNGRYEEARTLLLQSVKQNYTRANAKLGMLYFYGFGAERDSVKAVVCAHKAATLNDWWALICLGETSSNPSEAQELLVRAYPLVQRADEGGDPDAAYFLGGYCQNGIGTPLDYTSALQWYRKAVKAGSNFKEMATQRAQQISNYLTAFDQAEARFKEGNYDAAISEYMKAEKSNCGDKNYLKKQIALSSKNLAGQYYSKGDYSNSLTIYKFAQKYNPDDAELSNLLAANEKKIRLQKEDGVYKATIGIKDAKEAIRKWEEYADLYPDGKHIEQVNCALEENYIYFASLYRGIDNLYAKSLAERYLQRFPNGKRVKRAQSIFEACEKKLK